jgi:ElaB/YqjD/DUF883 family membrane-anchored ribosome-binding protein
MDRNTPMGSNRTGSDTNPVNAKVEDVAQTAHQTTDRIADKAAAEIDRASDTSHRVINKAAGAASSAADWAATAADQASEMQTRVTDAASASIRERPLTIVAGALVIGYLIGRIGS